jgi:uncharacterized membrane protein YhiD involved in acid resistance
MLGGIIARGFKAPTAGGDKLLSINTDPPREGHQRRSSFVKLLLAAAPICAVAFLIAAFLDKSNSSDLLTRPFQSLVSHLSEKSPDTAPDQVSISSQFFEAQQHAMEMNDPSTWLIQASKVTLRLLLASLLAAMLAFRPHKYASVIRRNPYVAQTQILLAVVASALMMIVSDNAARAFGIFAATSLVRFRTNIRDPKEITVLLINLAIGLATGVGRFDLALILSLFVLATLWVLELYESKQVVRSMQLKVKTHDVAETDGTLRDVFLRNKLTAEVRELDREDEKNPLGRIVYYLVGPQVSTDQLSDEIFAADPNNVDSVEWHQKKSESYTYR